jgi:uncharacterized protein GlcG (DUF336 family)
MTMISYETALSMAQAALAEARANGMAPMSVAVIDIGGHPRVALREDGAGFLGIEIAAGKARAALAFGCTSREIANALAGNPLAGPSVLGVGAGKLVMLAGGVPLRDASGALIGAIGLAGDAPDRDEAAALKAAGQ